MVPFLLVSITLVVLVFVGINAFSITMPGLSASDPLYRGEKMFTRGLVAAIILLLATPTILSFTNNR